MKDELKELQEKISEAYSVMPVEQLYKINRDLTDLQAQNDELMAKLASLVSSKSCATCNNTGECDYDDGFGGVASSPCHCTNNLYSTYSIINSTQIQSLADIRAEAVMDAAKNIKDDLLANETYYTFVAGRPLVPMSIIEEYANKLKGGE